MENEEELISDLTPEEESAELAARRDYEGEIIAIIRSNASPKLMREKLEDYHGNDIAGILPELTVPERKKLYRILPDDQLSDVLEHTDEEDGGLYLEEMDPKKAASVISELEPDHAVDILRQLPKEKRLILLDLLDEKSRKDVALIASFDEDEIGSKMTTNYIAIRENLTVKEAMASLVEQAAENDNIATLFVLDEYGVFYGAMDLKELIIARSTDNIEDLIVTSFPYVYARESIDDCLEKLKDYSEGSIPVLDTQNRLLGVITSQNVVQVVDEEMSEDYARFAGLTAEEDLTEPLGASVKKRIPWLLILLGLGMLVSTVVGTFENVIAQLPLIMAFQSLISGMAGNAGTQSLAVTIRVLMDESLTARQKIGLVFKEIRVGLCNGFLMGLASFILVGLYIFAVKGRTLVFAYSVSACMGAAMMTAMLIASATGTLIPLFFKKINIDPAVASGPLISTFNDLVAVITYYGLAWILLLQVLHFGS